MNNNKIYGLLGLTAKAGKVIYGAESCEEEIIKKKVKLIIIAQDSSERTIQHFKEKCEKNKINFYIYGKKDELSKAIGKENKAIIGIKDKNFAQAIQKILNGGDVIG